MERSGPSITDKDYYFQINMGDAVADALGTQKEESSPRCFWGYG